MEYLLLFITSVILLGIYIFWSILSIKEIKENFKNWHFVSVLSDSTICWFWFTVIAAFVIWLASVLAVTIH